MRKASLAGSLAVVAVMLQAASGQVAAQAAKPAAQTSKPAAKPAPKVGTMPRLPDGHPDLQGTYDVATMTPVERFPGMKNLVMTPEEAAAAEKYEAQRHQQQDAPVAADRSAPHLGGDKMTPKSYQEFLEAAGAGNTGGYNSFWLSEGTKFISVDGQKRSSLVIDPADGHIPSMNAEARARQARLRALTVAPDAAENAAAAPARALGGLAAPPPSPRSLPRVPSLSLPP